VKGIECPSLKELKDLVKIRRTIYARRTVELCLETLKPSELLLQTKLRSNEAVGIILFYVFPRSLWAILL